MIEVRYFARLREQLGCEREQFDPVPGDVATLLDALRKRGESWQAALSGPVLCAVNQELARPDTRLRDGDEVGLFPPVTGG